GIANSRAIRLPSHAADLLGRVSGARSGLESQLGRWPNTKELAAHLNVNADRIIEILRHTGTLASLSAPLRPEGDTELGELLEDLRAVAPPEAAAAALLPGRVTKALASLDQ